MRRGAFASSSKCIKVLFLLSICSLLPTPSLDGEKALRDDTIRLRLRRRKIDMRPPCSIFSPFTPTASLHFMPRSEVCSLQSVVFVTLTGFSSYSHVAERATLQVLKICARFCSKKKINKLQRRSKCSISLKMTMDLTNLTTDQQNFFLF